MKTLDQTFSFSSFCRASSAHKEELCGALTVWFKKEILLLTEGENDPRRRKVIDTMITHLRQLGHDLVQCDWSDDFERWMHNYGKKNSVGLMIRIDFEDTTEVIWHDVPYGSPGVVFR